VEIGEGRSVLTPGGWHCHAILADRRPAARPRSREAEAAARPATLGNVDRDRPRRTRSPIHVAATPQRRTGSLVRVSPSGLASRMPAFTSRAMASLVWTKLREIRLAAAVHGDHRLRGAGAGEDLLPTGNGSCRGAHAIVPLSRAPVVRMSLRRPQPVCKHQQTDRSTGSFRPWRRSTSLAPGSGWPRDRRRGPATTWPGQVTPAGEHEGPSHGAGE
jgi:hypothetical protein